MTAFQMILVAAGVIMLICLLASMVLIFRARDFLTRTVVSDVVFYTMIAIFLVWSMDNQTSIAYEIVILAALVAGVLPTISMARMISKGRR
ncbi:cation:proton antiporter [Corynebacterium halotolerans]|uniref:cation:proton antiporter n=1 Tax=Corynebacterium halotolerans TaxID=225326 RepID=UPI003CF3836D